MKYIEVKFICMPHTEVVTDVLSAHLAEIGFESFVSSDAGTDAYVPVSAFSRGKLDELLAEFPLDARITYSFREMEDRNWNEEWEKNYFRPIVVDDVCCIHSSFHHLDGDFRYRILIDPKMAFGTGHHQTTLLILKEILAMDFLRKSVLDMGCGTAVLAILASMKGAAPVTAVDIDEWAYNNALENIRLNRTSDIDVRLGGAELLGREKYDVIFANINRNILLQDIAAYARVLNDDGTLIMSGFYVEDIPAIRAKSEENGLRFCRFSEMENWAAVICAKQER